MKKSAQVGAAVLFITAFVMGRAIYESRHELFVGLSKIKSSNIEEAIHHFDRSAHWYAPGNPYIGKALDQLWNIGQDLESKGQPRIALLAYDAIRGSIHAIRSFYWPYKNRLPIVNDRIAKLRAQEHVAENPGVTYKDALAFHEKALKIDERPYVGWVFLLELGFFGWVFSVVGLIWKGFDPEGQMHLKPSFPWMISIVVCFSFWIVGLLHA